MIILRGEPVQKGVEDSQNCMPRNLRFSYYTIEGPLTIRYTSTKYRKREAPVLADQIVPGPCVGPCPPPTEIVCIETLKVYDFCFQRDTIENACFTIPAACTPPVPVDVTVSCAVTAVSSAVVARVPLPPPAPPQFARITFRVILTLSFTLTNPDGTVRCTFTADFPFLKTVVLCAPAGTDIDIEVRPSRCGPCFILGGTQICCELDFCILIQAKALVKLLVPAYGFCQPFECQVLPKPPLPCPPTPLFPPQCPRLT